jgi:hypothetical protein
MNRDFWNEIWRNFQQDTGLNYVYFIWKKLEYFVLNLVGKINSHYSQHHSS